MDNILVSITVGAAIVLLIDVTKSVFPALSSRALKFVTVVYALIVSAAILLAQNNAVVQIWIQNALTILGTSQALYSLVWKDTQIHKDIAG